MLWEFSLLGLFLFMVLVKPRIDAWRHDRRCHVSTTTTPDDDGVAAQDKPLVDAAAVAAQTACATPPITHFPVTIHPGLQEMFRYFVQHAETSRAAIVKHDHRFDRDDVRAYYTKAKYEIAPKDIQAHATVEDHLHRHKQRPFGPEGSLQPEPPSALSAALRKRKSAPSLLASLFQRPSSPVKPNNAQWEYRFGKYNLNARYKRLLLPFLNKGWSKLFPGEDFLKESDLTGYFYYPPRGFREWHTNRHGKSGYRLYLVHIPCLEPIEEEPSIGHRTVAEDDNSEAAASSSSSEDDDDVPPPPPQSSGMNALHPETKQFQQVEDSDGYCNLFHVSSEKPLWHSVWSDQDRFSLGIKLTRKQALVLMRLAAATV